MTTLKCRCYWALINLNIQCEYNLLDFVYH
nr:MAG TPA: hypothetical protein [Caudoviricetes sp.]